MAGEVDPAVDHLGGGRRRDPPPQHPPHRATHRHEPDQDERPDEPVARRPAVGHRAGRDIRTGRRSRYDGRKGPNGGRSSGRYGEPGQPPDQAPEQRARPGRPRAGSPAQRRRPQRVTGRGLRVERRGPVRPLPCAVSPTAESAARFASVEPDADPNGEPCSRRPAPGPGSRRPPGWPTTRPAPPHVKPALAAESRRLPASCRRVRRVQRHRVPGPGPHVVQRERRPRAARAPRRPCPGPVRPWSRSPLLRRPMSGWPPAPLPDGDGELNPEQGDQVKRELPAETGPSPAAPPRGRRPRRTPSAGPASAGKLFAIVAGAGRGADRRPPWCIDSCSTPVPPATAADALPPVTRPVSSRSAPEKRRVAAERPLVWVAYDRTEPGQAGQAAAIEARGDAGANPGRPTPWRCRGSPPRTRRQ